MAIYRQIYINKHTCITVWKIVETEHELIGLINDPEILAKAKSYKATMQRMQFLASQVLLIHKGLLGGLKKDENGKPHLSDGRFISLSHDTCYVALMIADYNCGIDLQSVSEKVLKIAQKFLSDEDCIQPKDGLDQLTLAWSVKEALYKIYGQPTIFFKEHLRLQTHQLFKRQLECQIIKHANTERQVMKYQFIDDIVLCFNCKVEENLPS
jgi:4'-phosphopantetheinyl transferase